MLKLAQSCAFALVLPLCLAGSPRLAAHGESPHRATPPVAAKAQQKPWGIAGSAKAVRRTVHIRMLDSMRFEPAEITAKRGETLRIVLHNEGQMLHEMVIGTAAELQAHAELMARFPNMEHAEPYMAHVPAGQSGEILWRFNKAGEFEFACLLAGHFQAGMRGRIAVK